VADEQQQRDTWIEDCERFFTFTQQLAGKFAQLSVEEKRALLSYLCSKLTLKVRRLNADSYYRWPRND